MIEVVSRVNSVGGMMSLVDSTNSASGTSTAESFRGIYELIFRK
jgi:hypothetical protein